MLKVGAIVDDKYRLLELLGQGGMGSVFLAEHVILSKRVAIKFLNSQYATDQEAVLRFYQEAQAAAAAGHKGIVEVHDIGQTEDGSPYLVMELLHGESLFEIMQRQGRIDVNSAVDVAVQVLSALIAVHKQGIIHRDLKPENIFVCYQPDGSELVKILDFGVSKVAASKSGARLTQTGIVLGTAYYMAPEQARGSRNIDHRVDVWAMGVILYEMLTGRLPFEGENYNEVLVKLIEGRFSPPREYDPYIPSEIENIILKALAQKREERYKRAVDLLHDVLAFRGQATHVGPSPASSLDRELPDLGAEDDDEDRTVVDPRLAIACKTTHLLPAKEATPKDDISNSEQITTPRRRRETASDPAQTLAGITKRATSIFTKRSRAKRSRKIALAGAILVLLGISAGAVFLMYRLEVGDGESEAVLAATKIPASDRIDGDVSGQSVSGPKAEVQVTAAGRRAAEATKEHSSLGVHGAVDASFPDSPHELEDPVGEAPIKVNNQGFRFRIQSKLSREEVRAGLRPLSKGVQLCLSRNQQAPQKIKTLVRISGSGNAALQTISPLQPPPVFSCVRQVVNSSRFRATHRPDITVVYPYHFTDAPRKREVPGFLPKTRKRR